MAHIIPGQGNESASESAPQLGFHSWYCYTSLLLSVCHPFPLNHTRGLEAAQAELVEKGIWVWAPKVPPSSLSSSFTCGPHFVSRPHGHPFDKGVVSILTSKMRKLKDTDPESRAHPQEEAKVRFKVRPDSNPSQFSQTWQTPWLGPS